MTRIAIKNILSFMTEKDNISYFYIETFMFKNYFKRLPKRE